MINLPPVRPRASYAGVDKDSLAYAVVLNPFAQADPIDTYQTRTKADESTASGTPLKYGARGGETITGNLGRDESGRFARVNAAVERAILRGSKKKPKKAARSAAQVAAAKRETAHAALQAAKIDKAVYDGVTALDDAPVKAGEESDAVKELVKAGYAEEAGGMIVPSALGSRLAKAAESGKPGKVAQVVARESQRTQQRAERTRARAQALDDQIESAQDKVDNARNDRQRAIAQRRLDAFKRKREALGDVSKSTLKHMPGKHSQSAHGRRGAVGGAFRSAYTAARAGGKTHSEAWNAGKTAAEGVREQMRVEKRAQAAANPKPKRTTQPAASAPTVQSGTTGEYPKPKLGQTVSQHLDDVYQHRQALRLQQTLGYTLTPTQQSELEQTGRDIARIEKKIQRGDVKRTDQARKPTKAEQEESGQRALEAMPTELLQRTTNNLQRVLDGGVNPKTKKPLTQAERALAELQMNNNRNELARRGATQPEAPAPTVQSQNRLTGRALELSNQRAAAKDEEFEAKRRYTRLRDSGGDSLDAYYEYKRLQRERQKLDDAFDEEMRAPSTSRSAPPVQEQAARARRGATVKPKIDATPYVTSTPKTGNEETDKYLAARDRTHTILQSGVNPKTGKKLTRTEQINLRSRLNEIEKRTGITDPVLEYTRSLIGDFSTTSLGVGSTGKAVLSSAQRRKLPGSSFVFPDTRSFPITDKRDIQKAVHAWGRYQGQYPFEVFKRRLIAIARRMGAVDALPDTWQVKTKAADHDMTPPQDVRDAAKRGLALRRKFGRGGTEVGIARARDLSNGASIPLATINRMVSFFARHAVDKRPDWSNPNNPSNGYIAWLLWGGDAGRRWALAMQKRMTKE